MQFTATNVSKKYNVFFILSELNKKLFKQFPVTGGEAIQFEIADKTFISNIQRMIAFSKPTHVFIDVASLKFFSGLPGSNTFKQSYTAITYKNSTYIVLPTMLSNIRYRNAGYDAHLNNAITLYKDSLSFKLPKQRTKFSIYTYKDFSSVFLNHALTRLLTKPVLTCDIETTGLNIDSNLLSIGFSFDTSTGIALEYFSRDREAYKQFFEQYQGTLVFHNGIFDIKHLIYTLWMKKDLTQITAMHQGLDTFRGKIQDTMILYYLHTNNTFNKSLSLKALSSPYMQEDYDKDVIFEMSSYLLTYNAKDCIATYYLYKQAQQFSEKQSWLYQHLYLPLIIDIVQMELTGLTIDKPYIETLQKNLAHKMAKLLKDIASHKYIKILEYLVGLKETVKKNKTLSTKINSTHVVRFNPFSSAHLQILFFDLMKFKPVKHTHKHQPSTDKKVIKVLINQAKPNDKALLKAIQEVSFLRNVLNTTLPNLLSSTVQMPDKSFKFYSSFNITGTRSGRISSPFLMTLPSKGSKYAEAVKQAFTIPKGYILLSCDYDGLEDVVLTLLSKDPNRRKIYLKGYDGHSFKTYYYFADEIDIPDESVASINSIQDNYPKLREKSKPCTFAMNYFGTAKTLVEQAGLSKEKAAEVVDNYNKLFQVTIKWYEGKFKEMQKTGYAKLAFGHKLHSQLIKRSASLTGNLINKELRTLGNALIQSYGLLTLNAYVKIQKALRTTHKQYREDVLPLTAIHDDLKFYVKDDPDVIQAISTLIKETMEDISECPELYDPDIRITASIDIKRKNMNE